MIKGAAAAIGFTVAIGTNMHDKANLSKDTKQEMLNICATDQDCIKALNSSFDDCFKSSMQADHLDGIKLASCINRYAGENYFAYERN